MPREESPAVRPPKRPNIFRRFFNRLMGRTPVEPSPALIIQDIRLPDYQMQFQLPAADLLTLSHLPPFTLPMISFNDQIEDLMTIDATIANLPRQLFTSETTRIAQRFFESSPINDEVMRELRREFERQAREQADPHQWWQETRHQQNMATELAVRNEDRNAEKLESLSDLEIPEEFICSISYEIMTNPVYDPKCPQQKFDLLVIRTWLETHETHPLTRQKLHFSELVYDEALKTNIDAFVAAALQTAAKPF